VLRPEPAPITGRSRARWLQATVELLGATSRDDTAGSMPSAISGVARSPEWRASGHRPSHLVIAGRRPTTIATTRWLHRKARSFRMPATGNYSPIDVQRFPRSKGRAVFGGHGPPRAQDRPMGTLIGGNQPHRGARLLKISQSTACSPWPIAEDRFSAHSDNGLCAVRGDRVR
jgi:hypothetical protein